MKFFPLLILLHIAACNGDEAPCEHQAQSIILSGSDLPDGAIPADCVEACANLAVFQHIGCAAVVTDAGAPGIRCDFLAACGG